MKNISPEHRQRFEAALASEDPSNHLYQLAKDLRDEGVSQLDLYFLFVDYHCKTSGDEPHCDAIADTLDCIWGISNAGSLYPTVLTNEIVKAEEEAREPLTPYPLRYSESLMRSAVWAFWRRVTGLRLFFTMAVLLVSWIYLISEGERSWWVWVFALVLCLAITFAIALYIVHLRAALARFRRMKVPEAIFSVNKHRLRATSDYGSSELSWAGIKEVWQFPEFWLLFYSRSEFMTLPLANLDGQARDFILECARSHGAKIS